jgi:neutral ceramidase
MRFVKPVLSALVGLSCGLILACCPGRAEGLAAGAATVDITPPTGFPMWGYGARHDAPSTGVLDPLRARALVLAVGPQRLALVSLDLGRAPTRHVTAAIRARVRDAAGVSQVFLVASHTHHGPVLELDTWPDRKDPYTRRLEGKLVDVITEAARTLRPARLGIASREVALNRNRHSHRPDKPVDRELLVLRVEDEAGKPIACAVNFAAHPTMQDVKQRKFSADYPGALAELVEKETGAPCLFLQGAAGDLSTNPGPERGPTAFGQALGREVVRLAATIRCSALDKPTLQSAEEDFRFRPRVDLGNPLVKRAFVAAFFPDLVNFYEREYREGVRPHLSVALLDGRIGFVGVSGEFFCSHALSLKRRARLEHLFFLGYCNDYQQYFPTIEAAAEGGYGADPGVANAGVGAGEQMIDHALIQLYRVRGRFPDLQAAK